MASSHRRPDVDGGLKEGDVFTTFALDESATRPPQLHAQMLADLGGFIHPGLAVRLLDGLDGAARWTSVSSFNQSIPRPQIHAAAEHLLKETRPRTNLQLSRRLLTSIGNSLRAAEQDHAKADAFYTAAHLVYLATIGKATWRNMPHDCRMRHIQPALLKAYGKACPKEAASLIHDSLTILMKEGESEVQLTQLDVDTEHLQNLYRFVQKTSYDVLIRILEHNSVFDDSLRQLLFNVRQVLGAQVGHDVKATLLSRAMLLWPHENFAIGSPFLDRLWQDQKLYINSLMTGEAVDFQLPRADHAPVQSNDQTQADDAADDHVQADSEGNDRVPTFTPDIEGLAPYEHHFKLVSSGLNYMYQARRQLDLGDEPADDWQVIRDNKGDYERGVYEAIASRPADEDGDNQGAYKANMVHEFEKTLKTIRNPSKLIVAMSDAIVKAVIDLHQKGDHFEQGHLTLRKDEKTMTANARMDHVLSTLKNTKKVVLDLLLGWDYITRFVAAPVTGNGRKYNNKRVNDLKRDKLTRGKAAQEKLKGNAEASSTILPESTTLTAPATDQPQKMKRRSNVAVSEQPPIAGNEGWSNKRLQTSTPATLG